MAVGKQTANRMPPINRALLRKLFIINRKISVSAEQPFCRSHKLLKVVPIQPLLKIRTSPIIDKIPLSCNNLVFFVIFSSVFSLNLHIPIIYLSHIFLAAFPYERPSSFSETYQNALYPALLLAGSSSFP